MTDDELNAAIATEVMGWCTDGSFPVYRVKRARGGAWDRWDPATDIAAAFEVVERLEGINLWIEIHSPSEADAHWCAFVWPLNEHGTDAWCATSCPVSGQLPRAICEAVLQAVRS